MPENREVIVMWTHLQLSKFASGPDTPEGMLEKMVRYMNSYIKEEKDKGELVRCFGGQALIGTEVTRENWEAYKMEIKLLNQNQNENG